MSRDGIGPPEFDLLFDERLTDHTQAGIAERLRYQRVSRLMEVWQKRRERQEGFAPSSAAAAFFRGLEAIARQAENGVLEFVDRWPVSYFVSRNYDDDAKEELAYGRLAADLLYSSLPDGTSPLAGLTFATPLESDGSLLAPAAGGRLVIRGLSGGSQPLIWHCSERTATVTDMSAAQNRVELDLPLQPADVPSAVFKPNAVAEGFELPILGDGAGVLLTTGFVSENEDNFASRSTVTQRPLSLAESVGRAHGILSVAWPDVIPWVRALVPAVADMGAHESHAVRLSGSFGPGEPIYLSRVSDPMFHAEDIIHEVQHLRFCLTIAADEWFGRWNDPAQIFISPYRTDLRPITGIHLGLHAFLAVTEFGLRTIGQPGTGEIPLSQLYDAHLRNLFAFHTIARHEQLSSEGSRYYRQLGDVLTKQHERIQALVRPARRKQILRSLNWPANSPSERATAVNASIDIRGIAAADEIAGLVASA